MIQLINKQNINSKFISLSQQNVKPPLVKNIFDESKHFYVCSYGGCGSTILCNYLSNFGNTYHIHDRYPPNKLTYVGKNNTDKDVYEEWFNDVEIPENELSNYKVIFIYRNPIEVIYSRFAQRGGPNKPHLKHIKCDNDGDININDVLKNGKDLYEVEDFFNNYTESKNKNYDIYCVKYELFFNNISFFNYALGIPDIKYLYPLKIEKPKKKQPRIYNRLMLIYRNLIVKMNRMRFIVLIKTK